MQSQIFHYRDRTWTNAADSCTHLPKDQEKTWSLGQIYLNWSGVHELVPVFCIIDLSRSEERLHTWVPKLLQGTVNAYKLMD